MKRRRDDRIRQITFGFKAARKFLSSKISYRVLLISVFIAFLVAGRSIGLDSNSVAWRWVMLSAFLTAPLIACNAAEYWLIARTHGLRLIFADCIRVTLIGSVANLLPIPGQSATRVADLASRRVAISQATRTTLAAGVLWAGWLFILAGMASLERQNALFPAGFLTLGIACCVLSVMQINSPDNRLRWIALGSLIELFAVFIAWWRLILSLEAIDIAYTFSSAAVLLCANVVSSAVGLAPAGLGIREAAGALIAPQVNIDPLAAAVAIALSRFVGLAVCTSLALVSYRPR